LQSSGKIIAFTDDDCYLTPGYLENCLLFFKERKFQFCGGRILLYDKSDSSYGCNFSKEFKIIPPYSFIPAGKIQGANMVFDRIVVDKIGLFDPMLGAGTPFRCEDIDYCARASLAGFAGAHVPDLVVYHHHGRKPGKQIEALKKDNDYARGAYYTKFILKGNYKYLYRWFKYAKNLKNLTRTMRELSGGLHYLSAIKRSWHFQNN
jgi:GT2 family glycosyltransferase